MNGIAAGLQKRIDSWDPATAKREHEEALKKWEKRVEEVKKEIATAKAEITGKDTIEVSSEEVSHATAVRFAWRSDAFAANLYNQEGLPASCFTTSDP